MLCLNDYIKTRSLKNYPQEDSKLDFSKNSEDYSSAYQRFIQDTNIETLIVELLLAIMTFQQCIYCLFDVSQREPNIYASGLTADIEYKILLDENPDNTYYIYVIITLNQH